MLRLLARGYTQRQIAAALYISTGTVHTRVAHIYNKLGVSTRAAALFTVQNGIIDR